MDRLESPSWKGPPSNSVRCWRRLAWWGMPLGYTGDGRLRVHTRTASLRADRFHLTGDDFCFIHSFALGPICASLHRESLFGSMVVTRTNTQEAPHTRASCLVPHSSSQIHPTPLHSLLKSTYTHPSPLPYTLTHSSCDEMDCSCGGLSNMSSTAPSRSSVTHRRCSSESALACCVFHYLKGAYTI